MRTSNKNRQIPEEIDRIIHEPSRYTIMAALYVTNSTDFLFLMHHTRLTGGNLSAHLRKLEKQGYISIKKEFLGNKPHTIIQLEEKGKLAFKRYRNNMKVTINTLPNIKSTKTSHR